ncbi:MAG: endolytic transglycosylase MltG [Gammaproteobacteria bacterium]|nr:endolytic transglycosylase MltG [Gammaproteobacteria bacterium]
MPGRLLKLLSATLLVLLLAAAVAGGMAYRNFISTPLNIEGSGLTYEVAVGMTLKIIAQDLQQRGVLSHAPYLVWLSYLGSKQHSVRAGEYVLEPGTTPPQLLEQLALGKVTGHALTLVEGWTFRQVLEAVARNEKLEHTLTGLSDAEVMSRLGFSGQHPEGRFYPDTYHFPKGASDADFLKRAYRAMERHLQAAWEGRSADLPLNTPEEALILASIVEKETGLASERPLVAGVFVRRMRIGMALQTDPTVIYGLGDSFDGNLRRSDLTADTPYNTYTRGGLPPTPIAMPGLDAIRAVLHPAEGDALFFVARGDGGHVFSATLAEHNRAVYKYQINGAARKKAAQE